MHGSICNSQVVVSCGRSQDRRCCRCEPGILCRLDSRRTYSMRNIRCASDDLRMTRTSFLQLPDLQTHCQRQYGVTYMYNSSTCSRKHSYQKHIQGGPTKVISTIFCVHNFAKCQPIFKILYLLDSARNLD